MKKFSSRREVPFNWRIFPSEWKLKKFSRHGKLSLEFCGGCRVLWSQIQYKHHGFHSNARSGGSGVLDRLWGSVHVLYMLLYNISKFGAVVNLTETSASSQVYVSKRGKTTFSKIFNSFFGVLYSIIISQELTKLWLLPVQIHCEMHMLPLS